MLYAGIDLGGTNIKAGLVDEEGRLLRQVSIPTEAAEGRERILQNMVRAFREAIGEISPSQIEAVGVGSPGPLDHRRGIVFRSPNLAGWENVPLADEMRRRTGVVTFVENDANAAMWGEFTAGKAKGCNSAIQLTLGTGIGGGMVIDGRLWRGASGAAPEVGHMTILPDGPRCNCGNRGCLEVLASATATAKRYREATGTDISCREIHERAANGDETALEVLEETGRYLGIGIATLVNVINPDIVVLSGGLSFAADILIPAVWVEVRERAFEVMQEQLRIETAALQNEAGIVGAAMLAAQRRREEA